MENRLENEEIKETIAIQIILMSDGQIKVVGPLLGDKTACYGLLELAKDAIRELHTPKITKPSGGLINHLRRFK